MKASCKSIIRAACHTFSGTVCAGAVLLFASSAQAQNLFEADYGSGNIYKFTPVGVKSTFASGLNQPAYLAFQPVPEPSALELLAVGATALLVHRHRAL